MSSSVAAKRIVVVLGAGPGLGFSVARKFAQHGHPVALLSRSQEKLENLASQINSSSDPNVGKARGYAVDATNESSLRSVIQKVEQDFNSGTVSKEHQGARIYTGVVNQGGGFYRKPFLETSVQQFEDAYRQQSLAAFVFSQGIIESITKNPAPTADASESIGNLLVTGATASLKGGAQLGTFAPAKSALRMLTQSIAREYMPKGIHVAHFIIDGLIATERVQTMVGSSSDPHSRLDPDAVAQVYFDTAKQPKSAWSFEVDLRPSTETW